MKNYFKSLFVLVFAAVLLAGAMEDAFAQTPSQISAPAGTSRIPSDYVDMSIPDDPVFIFCSPDANGDSVLGTLSVSGGAPLCKFVWGKYDPDPANVATYQTFVPFLTVNSQPSSLVSGLQSGFYQVIVTTNVGATNEAKHCRRAHVFVNETTLDLDPIAAGCQPFSLTGGIIDAMDDFTIYDPPPTPFEVDSNTVIKVCFWADHTFVSDLGFYLIGPGGNRVDLLPPVSAWDQGAQVTTLPFSVTGCDPADANTNCNSGNHLQNFCFTSALPAGNPSNTPCICDMSTPLTGNFASCGPWNGIYGNMASNGGWKVQVYDCTPADVGYLQKVTISFTGQSECGQTTYLYDSGPINVSITDNACTPATAATYTVPLKTTSSHTITNEVTAQWSSYPVAWNPAWGSQTYSATTNPNINPEPLQSTTFCLTVFDHLYDTLGNEITQTNFPLYNQCQPQVCQYYETLPTDATISWYPQYICKNSPPVQLIPLFYSGAWTANGQAWPNGPVTSNGWFYPNQALLGDNTINYAFSGVCADDETVIINVVDAPVVSNVQKICNGTNTQFQVVFTVVGGNPGSYQFLYSSDSTAFPGNYLGTTFTSGWINSPSSFSIIVTDNWDCDPSIVAGYHNCTCTSHAGNMPTALVALCETDQTNVQVLPASGGGPSYTLDANDGWEYFLHTGQFGVLGTVLGHNTTGIFQFIPGQMNYNQVYYISHVVGNNTSGDPANPLVSTTDGCLSVSQGTPVKWYKLPTAYAGLNDYTCGKTIQLDADTANVGVGTWSCLTASGVIYAPNFNTPKTSVVVPYFDTNQFGCLLNTNFIFRWTINNGPCQHFDDVTVTMKPVPDAFAGNDFSICGMVANLQASWSSLCGPTGQSEGEWLGSGNITDPLALITEVNVFNPGSYTYVWREYNGECVDEDQVTVTFIQQPIVDANHNDSVCGNVYALQAQSTMGVGWWTGPLGTSFSNATSPHSNATISWNGQSEVIANFTWTEQNSFCTASDNVSIVYSTMPNAAAGNDVQVCGTSFTFDADIIGYEYALGTWKTDFITAIFDDKHDPAATVTLPNTGSFPGTAPSGTFGDTSWIALPFTWVMDNNRCTDEDVVLISFYQIPTANAGHDTSVCGKLFNMTAKYSIGNSKGKWSMVSGPSSVPPTWQDNTKPSSWVQVPQHGLYVFRWKEDNLLKQTCTSSDEVSIYFIETPNVDAGPDRYICGTDFNLEAIASTGNGQWLPTSASITTPSDPHSATHYGLTGTNEVVTYVWQEYNEYNGVQCVDYDSVEIVFMIVPDAQVSFTAGSSTDHVCGKTEMPFDNIIQAVAPGITGPNVTAYWSANDSEFYPGPSAKDPDSVKVGNYGVHTFYWNVENHHGDSVCLDYDSLIVDFIKQPVANPGPMFDTACIDSVYSPYYHLQGSWSVNLLPFTPPGVAPDSLAGKWISTAPTGVTFLYLNATDTIENDTLPNNWVHVTPIDYINPDVYVFTWQEEHYGAPINGEPRNLCTDIATTTVMFAPRPTGKIETENPQHPPHCIGYEAKIKAKENTGVVNWDWSDIDGGIIVSSETGTPLNPGKGPIYVKWPNAEKLEEHAVRLITTNKWACKSIADAVIISEPDTVAVEISDDSEPAKCGDESGSIILLAPTSQSNTYNWIDSLSVNYINHSADMQENLATGDYFFSANSKSTVLPNPNNVRCTDTFMIHVKDTGYMAALFQLAILADTTGISPQSVEFINLSYVTDSNYVPPASMLFADITNWSPPLEEVDAEYEWRFYHIRYDSVPNFDSTIVIFPWEDPIEIDGETVFSDVNPLINFTDAGYYKIQLVTRNAEFGCTDTIVEGYKFLDAESDIVPGVNVFTPNGDGQNDFLEFETETLLSMKGQIFSRWGKLVYEWTWNWEDQTPNPGWWDGKLSNGQDASPGVYFYVIEGVGQDGTEFSGKEYAKAFHLIREKK